MRRALLAADLMDRYLDRPAYQRDDYLLWIASAKREDTRNRRIAQMLKELEAGGVYMRIPWRGLSSKREYAPRAPEETALIVNHFRRDKGALTMAERLAAPRADLLGWHSDFEPARVLSEPQLQLVEEQNLPSAGLMSLMRDCTPLVRTRTGSCYPADWDRTGYKGRFRPLLDGFDR